MLSVCLVVLAYMTIWFLAAIFMKRRDIVDSAWGLGFVAVATTAYLQRNNESIFALIALGLVAVWGTRLFLHITSRNWKKKEDYRYAQLGKLNSATFWVRTYVTIFLLQGALMIAISLPIIGIMQSTAEPHLPLASIAAGIWLFGILFEAVGDYQLRQFLRHKKSGIMSTGLWRYTRHPNYFGEITAWWGAAIMALSFGIWWGILGAFVITVLITRISGIPLLEARYKKDKAYQAYAAKTSILIPLPVRK